MKKYIKPTTDFAPLAIQAILVGVSNEYIDGPQLAPRNDNGDNGWNGTNGSIWDEE